MNESIKRPKRQMWNHWLLGLASVLSIAGCHCCPLPPSRMPFESRRTVAGLSVPLSVLEEQALFGEMPPEAGDIMVADQVEFIGCGNVLRVARIPFRIDLEVSMGGAKFFLYVRPEKAELARSALSRSAHCPGYRCDIVRPVSTVETANEK